MYLEMLELCVVDADERASDDLGESVGSGNEEKRIEDHFQFRIVWVGIGRWSAIYSRSGIFGHESPHPMDASIDGDSPSHPASID
jgi:hypothetical protein